VKKVQKFLKEDFEKQNEDKRRAIEDDKLMKTFDQIYVNMVEERLRNLKTGYTIDEETGLPVKSPRQKTPRKGATGTTPRGTTPRGSTPRSFFGGSTTPRGYNRGG
jgi:hypothetical protein